MADVSRLLDTMHPMREPPPPDAVTPYLVLIALGCVVAAAVLFAIRLLKARRDAVRASAEAALEAAQNYPPDERLAAQANLLRRLVRVLAGDEAARLQGEPWLERLDRLFETSFFTQGAGKAFGSALYRRPDSTDVDALDRELRGLFAKVCP